MANSSAAISTRGHRVYHWKEEEDVKLTRLVHEHGPQNWKTIAQHIEGRTGKSCRLRWRNHLEPGVNREPFTREEEERLLSARETYGGKWAFIASFFNGRTDNSLKNHWNVLMARKRRQANNHQNMLSTADAAAASVQRQPSFCGSSSTAATATGLLHPNNGASPRDTRSFYSDKRPFSSMRRETVVPSFESREGSSVQFGDGRMSLLGNSFSELGASSSSSSSSSSVQVELNNGSGEKQVPFFDFLGVGDQ